MEFHDQPLQFINKHYFQIGSYGNNTANTIIIILHLFMFIHFALLLLSSNILFYNMKLIHSLFKYFTKLKIASLPSLLITSVAVSISLLAFHICAIIDFVDYEREVFNSSYSIVAYQISFHTFCILYFMHSYLFNFFNSVLQEEL